MMDARPTTDLETHRVAVTFFADQYAKKKVVKQLTLGDILEMVLHVRAPTKKKLPWLKLATFGDKTTGKGSLRHDDNVLAVCGVELDYDLLLISMDEAVAKLRELGIRSLVYTSPSNTKLQSKFRILAPFAAERPPRDRGSSPAALPVPLDIPSTMRRSRFRRVSITALPRTMELPTTRR